MPGFFLVEPRESCDRIGEMENIAETQSNAHADRTWNHIYPLNDLMEHKTDNTQCDCLPRIDVENRMFIHNALDNREFDEIADAIANSNL